MELPVLICSRREAGPLTTDAESDFWRGLPAVAFGDVVSGAEPEQGTSVRAAWDAEELRVLFHASDTHAWATLTERDAPLYEEEVVEVFLDPVGDSESYFEIEVNPLNAVLDLVLRRNRSGYVKDFAWRCQGLRTAVATTDAAWTAELAIPFRSLITAPPQAGDRWRVNFCRIDRPPGVPRELTAWSPAGRANFHTPERFGVLQFAE
jgi:Carbohydrate family 9 binding domain-like